MLDDDGPTDAADVSSNRLLVSEAIVQLLPGDTDTVDSRGYAATTTNNTGMKIHPQFLPMMMLECN